MGLCSLSCWQKQFGYIPPGIYSGNRISYCQHFSVIKETRVKNRNKILMCVTDCCKFAGCPQHSILSLDHFDKLTGEPENWWTMGVFVPGFQPMRHNTFQCLSQLIITKVKRRILVFLVSSWFLGTCVVWKLMVNLICVELTAFPVSAVNSNNDTDQIFLIRGIMHFKNIWLLQIIFSQK